MAKNDRKQPNSDDAKRDQVLKKMLGTPPKPKHRTTDEPKRKSRRVERRDT